MTKQEIIESFTKIGLLNEVKEVYAEKSTSTIKHTGLKGKNSKNLLYYYLWGTFECEERLGECIIDIITDTPVIACYEKLEFLQEVEANCYKL